MATTDIEKENLEAHVELCAERYKQLDNRLGAIETKVGNLQKTLEESHMNTVRVLIGTAGTIIVGVLSLIGVILTKMP
jgi:hypothetical protein